MDIEKLIIDLEFYKRATETFRLKRREALEERDNALFDLAETADELKRLKANHQALFDRFARLQREYEHLRKENLELRRKLGE